MTADLPPAGDTPKPDPPEAASPEDSPFLRFISRGALTTDDALAALLPLFRQVLETHARGLVAPLEGVSRLRVEGYRLYFESAQAMEPRLAPQRIHAIDKQASAAFDVIGHRAQTTDADDGEEEHKDLLLASAGDAIDRPRHVPGYVSWEHLCGHHDALTDLYSLGLLLASVSCGFDFTKRSQMEAFVWSRRNLFAVAKHLNPVIAKNIVRLTEPGRHQRAQDLASVIRSLERYRDQEVDPGFDLTRIPGFHGADPKGRSRIVLSRLRERLFEISRRNRLLYFKPTLQTLNLTLASVPVLLDVKSIRPEQIFSWHRDVEKALADGASIPLARYLRFEDAPYLPNVLDKLISEARRDTTEFGFSRLRLVIAFLRWHNLKESPNERIDSPLLLMPVELSRKKGVRDSYVMRATSREAEVNPVLRHHLKQLFDINLPHSIDLSETTLQSFHDLLQKQIEASEPGVVLTRLDKPQVELVYARARRRLDQYRRRLRVSGPSLRSFKDLDYSYDRDNYQPLGLKLFIGQVRPARAPLHDLVSRERPVQEARMSAEVPGPRAGEKEKLFVSIQDGATHGNPYSWDFDLCSLTLGNFNYRKMSLVRDYNSLIESGQTAAPFDGLFSLSPKPQPARAEAPDLAERFPVVSCDPTQLRALALAATGSSYIIQGPPGTGKSQTITNLIADLVAQGKRVLFVCEKRAAIDVVYHRLRQRNLHGLACLIHDSQADKREFILDLKQTYEGLLKEGGDPRASARRDRSLAGLKRGMEPVTAFDQVMRATTEEAGVPFRALLLRLIALRDSVPELSAEEEDDLPQYEAWAAHVESLARLGAALRHATRDGIFSGHPLALLSPRVASMEKPRAAVEQRLQGALKALDRMESLGRQHHLTFAGSETLDQIVSWARYAALVKPLADRGLLALLRAETSEAGVLREAVAERKELAEALESARQSTRGWKQKLPPDDLAAARERTKALGPSVWRFFKGDFWQLRKVLNERYDFSSHAVPPTWDHILGRLQAEYDAEQALARADAAARATYGAAGGLDAYAAELEGIRHTVNSLLGPNVLDKEGALGADPSQTVSGLVALSDVLLDLERSVEGILNEPRRRTLGMLRDHIQRVLKSLALLPDWVPCLMELASLPEGLQRAISDQPLTLKEIEAALVARTVAEVWRRNREVARFGGGPLEVQAARIGRSYDQWLEVNADVVIQRNRDRFQEHVARASLPSVRLTREQEEFKRRYNAGRRELEHEFGKSMRYKSVRALLAGPSGEVILDLKPVWLMSPLSVSDTLPIESGVFDVVIFDEASQIPLEEAVPALFRADQVVVSGDQMQLPPTNFFSATRDHEENLLIEDEEEGEPSEYELDGNSFLSHAARNLPSTMLGWHYRSRSESLISFSNAAFYDSELLTVPERAVQDSGRAEIRPQAPEEGEKNAALLLERPVSFHHLEGARYESRRNPAEAAYIAHLVKGLLAAPERPSIGIVAFSEAQQTQIETALERLAAQDKEFGARLEEEYEREEDGQFSGLIVKNLENIQGDERDVILLSVCYGPGPDGRMLMNFGPINQSGGEKRLNVAFSRAKKHMAVVSSIPHTAITNVYNDGANALRNYLQYAAAMSSGDSRTAAAILKSLGTGRAGQEVDQDLVVTAVAEALKSRGLEVEAYVGQSHFRCHLAVRKPGETSHGVAIFVDTEGHYDETDVLEREVLKPALLRAFGWTVCHVFTKDWQEDREGVLSRIERRLSGEAPEPGAEAEVDPPSSPSDAPDSRTSEPPSPSGQDAPARPPILAVSTLLPGQRRYFEYVGGSSSKFWHVTVDGSELVVAFGRIGTDGQVSRKAFPTSEAARAEAEKLIREKLGKGYQEVGQNEPR